MEYEVQPFFKTLAVLASLFSTEIKSHACVFIVFLIDFFSAARSTRRKATQARFHTKRTKRNTCQTSSILEAITTPRHIQDEATGDVDRSNLNKHCTEQELSLFQNKKQSETLQRAHRKALRLSSRSALAQ